MRADRHWGDHISCRTVCDFVHRPVIIWRSMEPDQDPHCFVPLQHTTIGLTTPIYLRLEEDVVGSEHYTALVWVPEPPEAPAAARAAPKPAPKTRTPAEVRGLHGLDAIGEWGKLGLTRAEYQALLELDSTSLAPLEAMAELRKVVPDLDLTGLNVKFFDNMKDKKSRHKEATQKFQNQLAVIEKVKEGVASRQEVVGTKPGVGKVFIDAVRREVETTAENCWRLEYSKMFSVQGLHSSGRDWKQPPRSIQSWVAKSQEWMRVPSWIFCPDCGHRELQTHVAWHWRRHPEACAQRPCFPHQPAPGLRHSSRRQGQCDQPPKTDHRGPALWSRQAGLCVALQQ